MPPRRGLQASDANVSDSSASDDSSDIHASCKAGLDSETNPMTMKTAASLPIWCWMARCVYCNPHKKLSTAFVPQVSGRHRSWNWQQNIGIVIKPHRRSSPSFALLRSVHKVAKPEVDFSGTEWWTTLFCSDLWFNYGAISEIFERHCQRRFLYCLI